MKRQQNINIIRTFALLACWMSPTAGYSESRFEQLFSTEQIPFPIEALEKKVGVYGKRSTLIPDSRSLQRKHVSFKFPRVIKIFNPDLTEDTGSENAKDAQGLIFVGYSEKAEQLEVISWDPTANHGRGRYEFQIVKNYGPGKKPKIETPPRESCLLCHQGGGPIFTSSPWSETPGFHARDPNGIHPKLVETLLKDHPDGKYQGVPIRPNGFEIVSINRAIRVANEFIQAKRVCAAACGDKPSCRRALVAVGLAKQQGKHFPFDLPYTLAKEIKVNEREWPEDDFGHPASLLVDRDPMESDSQGKIGFKIVNKETGKDATFDEKTSSSTDLDYLFIRVPLKDSEKHIADPKYPRPIINRLAKDNQRIWASGESVVSCLGFTDQDRVAIYGAGLGDPLALNEALSADCVKPVLNEWPPIPNKVVHILIQFAKAGKNCSRLKSTADCPNCLSEREDLLLSPPMKVQLEKIAEKNIAPPAAKPMQLFQANCATCHAGASNIAPQLPLQDNELSKLAEYRSANGESAAKLIELGIMPPAPLRLPENSKKIMLEALK